MKRHLKIRHEFVEFIPKEREDGVLYVSMSYATAVHNCLCGCGFKVVTPIHPAGWKLTFDGDTVSLSPSIGNSGFPCRSHYWIDRNVVEWARPMTPETTAMAKAADRAARDRYFNSPLASLPPPAAPGDRPRKVGWLSRLFGRR